MIRQIFKMQPAFQLNIVFFVGLSLLVIIFSNRLPFVNFFILFSSIALFQIYLDKVRENMFLSFIKNICFPVSCVLIAFDTIGELIPYINPRDIDEALLNLDYLIFGFYPYIYFDSIVTPWLTELMQISYCVYYFLPFIIGIYLIKRGDKQEFYRTLFIVLFCFYLSYIGYIIFPAVGPRYSIPHMFQNELNGLLIAEEIKDFLNYLEGIKRDAFPSGHVAISLVVLSLMLKYSKKLFGLTLMPVILLIISTMYCRYHYFVDVLAGIFLAVVSLVIGNLYYNFWLSKNGDSFIKRQRWLSVKGFCKDSSKNY